MLPLMRWRYAVADGPPPGTGFTFLDYVALGFILPGAEEILRRPKEGWPIYVPALILGFIALAFRGRSIHPVAWLLNRLPARRKLAAARAEIASLEKRRDEDQDATSREVTSLKAQIKQLRAESVSIAVNGKLVAGPAAFEEQRKIQSLLSPLQIEALTLAKELRDFIATMPPYPSGPTQNPGEDDHAFMVRHIAEQFTLRRKWDQKLKHAYANRGIGPRITSFLHRFAEAFDDAPVGNANYAEDLGFPTDEKTIPKLAQEMEMMAIWINRKERGEVNLIAHLCHNCGRMADPRSAL